MRAAVSEEYGEPLDIVDVKVPDPAPDGAVVEVEVCGICRSGRHDWQGDRDRPGETGLDQSAASVAARLSIPRATARR